MKSPSRRLYTALAPDTAATLPVNEPPSISSTAGFVPVEPISKVGRFTFARPVSAIGALRPMNAPPFPSTRRAPAEELPPMRIVAFDACRYPPSTSSVPDGTFSCETWRCFAPVSASVPFFTQICEPSGSAVSVSKRPASTCARRAFFVNQSPVHAASPVDVSGANAPVAATVACATSAAASSLVQLAVGSASTPFAFSATLPSWFQPGREPGALGTSTLVRSSLLPPIAVPPVHVFAVLSR